MPEQNVSLVQLLPNDGQGPQGCAAAIIADSEVKQLEVTGFVDLQLHSRVTETSSFYVGSTSKMFTAICVALLQKEGRIGFGDDVRDYIPELPEYDTQILISDLLWHTSGLRDYIELLRMAGHGMRTLAFDNTCAIEIICRQRHLNCSPGTARLYSNSNYVLLAEIINRVTGRSLRECARDRIFSPLRMERTDFDDGVSPLEVEVPVSYTIVADGVESRTKQFCSVGDGGMVTCLQDMCTWAEHKEAFGNGIVGQLTAPGRLRDGTELPYGFGQQLQVYRGLPTAGHSGGSLGWACEFRFFPTVDLTVVCMTNQAGLIRPHAISRGLAEPYLPLQCQISGFVGSYQSEELGTKYSISTRDRNLHLERRLGSEPETLKPEGWDGDQFVSRGISHRFTRDHDHVVTGLAINSFRVDDLQLSKSTQS